MNPKYIRSKPDHQSKSQRHKTNSIPKLIIKKKKKKKKKKKERERERRNESVEGIKNEGTRKKTKERSERINYCRALPSSPAGTATAPFAVLRSNRHISVGRRRRTGVESPGPFSGKSCRGLRTSNCWISALSGATGSTHSAPLSKGRLPWGPVLGVPMACSECLGYLTRRSGFGYLCFRRLVARCRNPLSLLPVVAAVVAVAAAAAADAV